ncbi:MAG TPA: thioesterase family protein [Chroococcidiopsis sp.]
MTFTYLRIVHFQDTDAAGVVYFANALAIAHEAYEASLVAAGIDLKAFFRDPELAVPIVHASVDFMRPMYCGDRLQIYLKPQILKDYSFEIDYAIHTDSDTQPLLSRAMTRHVCIHPSSRAKLDIPKPLQQWLQQTRGL